MKSWGAVGLVVGMVWVGPGIGLGQETAQAAKPAPIGLIYEAGPDVSAPELLQVERAVESGEPCTEAINGEVSIWLVIDDLGEPRNLAVIDPKGTSLEKLAVRVVKGDSFAPGSSDGAAVAVKELVQVKLEACFATKIDAAGNKSDVLRLTAQPVQTFSKPSAEATQKAMGSSSDGEGGSTGLYRIGKGVSPPVPRNSVEAVFSDEARSKQIQGVVLVQMIVDANGMPQHPRVVRGMGYGLDEQALKAVMKYHFKPAMKEGSVPVPVMITVEVNFRLYDRH